MVFYIKLFLRYIFIQYRRNGLLTLYTHLLFCLYPLVRFYYTFPRPFFKMSHQYLFARIFLLFVFLALLSPLSDAKERDSKKQNKKSRKHQGKKDIGAFMTNPPPRLVPGDDTDDFKEARKPNKRGVCGGLEPSQIKAIYVEGGIMPTNWEVAEKLRGPCTFEVSKSGKDSGFRKLKIIKECAAQKGENKFALRLPKGLVCDHCVVRWTWKPKKGESYVNCADVRIIKRSKGVPGDGKHKFETDDLAGPEEELDSEKEQGDKNAQNEKKDAKNDKAAESEDEAVREQKKESPTANEKKGIGKDTKTNKDAKETGKDGKQTENDTTSPVVGKTEAAEEPDFVVEKETVSQAQVQPVPSQPVNSTATVPEEPAFTVEKDREGEKVKREEDRTFRGIDRRRLLRGRYIGFKRTHH
ncbi:uncharacterized protein VTP21DRAFT_6078 [Calcarisporiella thermophila]|uniref:uncharacterized protein n=1 Tax=Calcarisporiella thermophila TaxID=911321 RepID=UPI003742E08E